MDDVAGEALGSEVDGYHPPTVTYLGSVRELTQQAKEVGAADGTVFDGVDLGSV